jgi:hypothetical protein
MGIEEMQRWFMSNAEVQMYQAKPLPVWAKAKVFCIPLFLCFNFRSLNSVSSSTAYFALYTFMLY